MKIIAKEGAASATGFHLILYGSPAQFSSKNYKKDDIPPSHLWWYHAYTVITSLIFTYAILSHLLTVMPLYLWLPIFILLLPFSYHITLIPIILFPSKSRLKQWHACEHKLAYLLENDKPVSMESLKKAPMLSDRDGLHVYFFKYRWSFPLLCAVIYPYIAICLLGLCLLSTISAIYQTKYPWLKFLDFTLYLSYCGQIFTTAEPTNEQLREALRLGNTIKFYFQLTEHPTLIIDLSDKLDKIEQRFDADPSFRGTELLIDFDNNTLQENNL